MKRIGMVRVGLYLSDFQMKKLKTISKKKGLSVSEIIRRMIDEGLERLKEGK
ncbi:MAG TPA: ribbon-helix-helix protein, CopG family [Thermodesulfobacteriota bacterium]|nr:ribbon-helix-helix protein, CopG family [Thermodesulfobacteriota bacterium]